MKQVKIINNVEFKAITPQKVCDILLNAMNSHRQQRLKLYFGDAITGQDWCEEYDTTGYIGRSTGTVKIPLLINNSRSMGGGAISDSAIVKIKDVKTGMVLYCHPNYKAPKVEITKSDMPEYAHNTVVNGVLHGRHKSLRSAQITVSRIA